MSYAPPKQSDERFDDVVTRNAKHVKTIRMKWNLVDRIILKMFRRTVFKWADIHVNVAKIYLGSDRMHYLSAQMSRDLDLEG